MEAMGIEDGPAIGSSTSIPGSLGGGWHWVGDGGRDTGVR